MSDGNTTSSNTPYDDVFRTLLNDCSSLIIPVINEVFGEDNGFLFSGNWNKKEKYHLECQSTTDNKMIVRMFEYDTQIALDAGEISYQVLVMKTQQYTLDEIFEKRLLFLIPFYIFTHESRFAEYENNADKRELLIREVMGIIEKLEQMALAGEISEYEKCTIIDMTRKVVEKITAKYENVRKEVTSVMGGKVLEYEAKTILQSGINKGKIEGKIEGKIDSILELLEEHGNVSEELRACIQEEKDMEVLKSYLKKASRVQSVEEFEQWVLQERKERML